MPEGQEWQRAGALFREAFLTAGARAAESEQHRVVRAKAQLAQHETALRR